MSKIITDELIEARLRKINVLEKEELDHDEMLKTITDHFEFEITDDWPNNPDMMFYSETTADGYEVWIATDNERNPSVNEDIYYYDNDWLEKMPDAMIDGATIYTMTSLMTKTMLSKRLLRMYMTIITMIKNKKLKMN